VITIEINLGGVIDAVATDYTKVVLGPRDFTAMSNVERRGTIVNLGPVEVFLGWNKEYLDAVDESMEADKAFLMPVGSATGITAIRVPLFCEYYVCRTAAGTTKLIYVED
jgi:hypothetical protein